MDMPSTSCF